MTDPALRTARVAAAAFGRLLAAVLLVIALVLPDGPRPVGPAPAAGGISIAGAALDALLPEASGVLRLAPAGETPPRLADRTAIAPDPLRAPAPPGGWSAAEAPSRGVAPPAGHPVRPASQGPPAPA
jgi:hypothetical protein